MNLEMSNLYSEEIRQTFKLPAGVYTVYVLGHATDDSNTVTISTISESFSLALPNDCRELRHCIEVREDAEASLVLGPNVLNMVIRDGASNAPCEYPRILTIIPLYNCVSYIERAIHSLSLQTLPPSKICIIDDCSTDKSLDIARIASLDIPVDFFQSVLPLGPFLCKNLALHAFREHFDFVTFLDSDDLILHNTYQRLLSDLGSHPEYSAVYPNFVRIAKGTPRVFPPHPIHQGQYRECFAGLFARTSFFDQVGYFDCVRYGADGEFDARCRNLGKPVLSTNTAPLYFAELRGGSLTQIQDQKVDLDDTRPDQIWLSEDRSLYAQRFLETCECKSVFNVPVGVSESMRIFKYADIRTQKSYVEIESKVLHRSFFLDMSVSGDGFTNLWRKI